MISITCPHCEARIQMSGRRWRGVCPACNKRVTPKRDAAPRVTITLRHSGRIYIGCGIEDFFTLFLGFRSGFPFRTPEDHRAGKERINKAFESFTAKCKNP